MSVNSDLHKEDILKAAIAEFGKMGYKAASTNEIVKNAKVSKGLLFHYFTSKQKLYTACQLYVMEQYGKFMQKHRDISSPDFFDRILSNLRIKMQFGCKNPELLVMINRSMVLEREDNPLSRPALEAYVLKQMEGEPSTIDEAIASSFFNDIDTSPFREGSDLAKVMDYARLTLEASWQRFTKLHNNDIEAMVQDLESYFSEAEEIVELLKHGAYS